jgi:sec-independent protein translocase protein TatA
MEILMILLIVLLLFGAKKLPELARGLGESMREFTKAREDVEREVRRAAETLPAPEPAPGTQPRPATANAAPAPATEEKTSAS